MSLVSLKNLSGPLHGWRLATIILVTALLAVFRISGGVIRTAPHNELRPREDQSGGEAGRVQGFAAQEDEAKAALDPRSEIERLGKRTVQPPAPGASNDLLQELMGSEKRQAAKQNSAATPSQLDDIEKRLGLK